MFSQSVDGRIAHSPVRRARIVFVLVIGALIIGGQAQADVVSDWNLQALRVPFAVGPPQARVLAMVHVAMHDAINSVTGDYQPYAIKLHALPGASPIAAGAAAAHSVLVDLFPAMAAAYDEALTASLEGVPEPGRSRGIEIGMQVGAHILALRSNDGMSLPAPYSPGSGPGVWVPTPPAFAPALLPGLGRVVPFALLSGDQFRPNGPPSLLSDKWAADLMEVQAIGASNAEALGRRTPEQSATARFWLGNMIPIMQQIALQMSTARGLSLADNARFFALISIAGFDAYIAAWDAKYTYNFWRPITAIQHADLDGNPLTTADPSWTPLGPTPPFPDYVSGHTAYTRACVRVLEEVFGRAAVSFTVMNPAVPPAERVRTYTSFRQLSEEMIEARVLAGIHFRTADRHGDRLGRRVAQFAIKHVLRAEPRHKK
jgi:hypothetical protein